MLMIAVGTFSVLSAIGIKLIGRKSRNRKINSKDVQNTRGQSKWSQMIPDKYTSLQDLWNDMNKYGLESCNLIIGIDYTKSNEWTGKESYDGENLHSIDINRLNPYEEAIAIIAQTLPALDEDSIIPCYGFGDVSTHDKLVFSFYDGTEQTRGLENLLKRYRQVTPNVQLSGPTSFGPIIRQAIHLVNRSGCQYHILVIIADGQVTRDPDTPQEVYSFQERDTMRALEEASQYPLSIIVVGVGDGPWQHMHRIDDEVGKRRFDNLQFVNFSEIMAQEDVNRDQCFALKALNEVPQQFRIIVNEGLLGDNDKSKRQPTPDVSLPPPQPVLQADLESKEEKAVKEEAAVAQIDPLLDDQLHSQLQNLLADKADLLQKVQLLGNENQSLRELLQYAAQPSVGREDSFYGRSNTSFNRQDSLYAISEKDQVETPMNVSQPNV
eukprot:TRINITY_DN6608_c0_g2_i3.p1 TRINITY_DN6608_c0_g2~~TRINITY_DN6608_c0_g2_i3.p1  ORF type:complete len:459 (-),score=39.01 TRINITY_DN6608_c0_g2_i3:284-1597(-)